MNRTTLPNEEIDFILSLPMELKLARMKGLWTIGWSLSEIGNSFSPPVPKATLHYRLSRVEATTHIEANHPLPEPNFLAPIPLQHEYEAEIKNLSLQARKYRSKMDPASAPAVANQKLTEMVKYLRKKGVPAVELAKAAGVSYRAMAKRLAK